MIRPSLIAFMILLLVENAIGSDTTQEKQNNESTREFCRAHRDDMELMANCIDSGSYDPCEDIGSQSTIARCYAAHTYASDRRIEKAENYIHAEKLGELHPAYANIDKALSISRKKWEIAAEEYCQNRDRISQAVEKKYGIQSSYPDGVDPGQEFNDCMLQAKNEWARELESFVAEFASKNNRFNKHKIAARLRGFLLGDYPLFQRRGRKCK